MGIGYSGDREWFGPRRAFRRAVLVLCAAASLAPAATLVRFPYLQNASSHGVAVLWATSEAGAGVVEYSADASYSSQASARMRPVTTSSGQTVYQYQADLAGLTPGREYFYRVRVDGAILAEDLRLRTAGTGPFTFLAFADSGTGGADQKKLAELMLSRENPALVLHAGDLSQESGTLEQLEAAYFSIYAPLMSRAPFFPAPGNHDYYTDLAAPYRAVHAVPAAGSPDWDAGRYYSFDWGNVHFISLDSNLLVLPQAAGRMLAWLEADLARQKRFWKVVYFHHPPYPSGHHYSDPISAAVREKIVPVLDRYRVQLVLSGHEHGYQRSQPLRDGVPAASGATYVITGGGGGNLHRIGLHGNAAVTKAAHHYLRGEVNGARMKITAVGLDGSEVDSFTLSPAPGIAQRGVVDAAAYGARLSPGSLVSVFGENLGSDYHPAERFPLPEELAGVSVAWNGKFMPLLFVSAGQINAQLPYGQAGPGVLLVKTQNGEAEMPLTLAEAAPAIAHVERGGQRIPAMVRARNWALVTEASPARPGDVVTIFATGLGPLDRDIAAGQRADAGPLLRVRWPVEVHIGGISVTPLFAGLSPGFAGLYQVNVVVPQALPGGVHSLLLVVNQVSGVSVPLPVGAAETGGQ